MNKFTFKMKDRMKLVIEKNYANSCTLTISGKEDTVFHFGKKRAADLVNYLNGTIVATVTYGISEKFLFRKTAKAPAGGLSLIHTDVDSYRLVIYKDNIKIFTEDGLAKKQVKKIIKVMKEVYEVG